ncbi:MogA/MoaB family molybdenum cofactor biosynthesis protein [Fusobacterium sp.]|uniref:MogA/MoaB family molybdenum cofactor biosynthesis protein n=1 Tax=Fusobacterium sp. TaxID=68766 RepID=UPI002621B459|nr:MogA/MoaB family molybdenum cofactor biosynthesis protein [Fusobacterium sp.]
MYKVAIVTISDKGSRGEREDITGVELKKMVDNHKNYKTVLQTIIPDEKIIIVNKLNEIIETNEIDLILTNGGTGFSQRDVTPEATLSVIEKEARGIAEYMRMQSMNITKRAMLSRGVCGIKNETIILNLPGSPKGACENLEFVIDTLVHGLDILKGSATECARK